MKMSNPLPDHSDWYKCFKCQAPYRTWNGLKNHMIRHDLEASEAKKLRPKGDVRRRGRNVVPAQEQLSKPPRAPRHLVQATLMDNLDIGPAILNRPWGWNLTMSDKEAENLKQRYKQQCQVSPRIVNLNMECSYESHCVSCFKKFKSRSHLNDHMHQSHMKHAKYLCWLCDIDHSQVMKKQLMKNGIHFRLTGHTSYLCTG